MNTLSSVSGSYGVMQSASSAIGRAVSGLSRDAATVASSAIDAGGDVMSALIDSRQQLLYAQAGARLMETADRMMGTLLDVSA